MDCVSCRSLEHQKKSVISSAGVSVAPVQKGGFSCGSLLVAGRRFQHLGKLFWQFEFRFHCSSSLQCASPHGALQWKHQGTLWLCSLGPLCFWLGCSRFIWLSLSLELCLDYMIPQCLAIHSFPSGRIGIGNTTLTCPTCTPDESF